jgi:hypothetical protein
MSFPNETQSIVQIANKLGVDINKLAKCSMFQADGKLVLYFYSGNSPNMIKNIKSQLKAKVVLPFDLNSIRQPTKFGGENKPIIIVEDEDELLLVPIEENSDLSIQGILIDHLFRNSENDETTP